MTTGTIRIVIGDDQDSVRSSLRRILESQPDLRVVGEAPDGLSTVEHARELRPDLVLVDIRMPRLDGLAVTRALAGPQATDPLRVVVVTTYGLDEYVYAALRNGASGFLLKRAGPALLVEGVRAAVAGDVLISPQLTVRLLRHVTGSGSALPAPSPCSGGPPGSLTRRELEIARLVARASTNIEIAARLVISPGTVKTHVASIQRKLGVPNRVGIAAWAWQMGVVED